MHNANCQATNSSRNMTGAGRPSGEPPEMAWAYLGGFGLILQYMSLASRAEFLERLFRYWNQQKLEGLVGQLSRMHARAALQLSQARVNFDELRVCALQELAMDEDQVSVYTTLMPCSIGQPSWQFPLRAVCDCNSMPRHHNAVGASGAGGA